VDHHDTFLPWVKAINEQEDRKTYASRVLFFLSKDQTLKPIAIELVLVETTGKDKKSRVFTPQEDSSKKRTLWTLAKAHAMSNEMTMHQAVSHFTLCHAVFESVIIAGHRHLSKLHPLMQLLHPHFKHTLTVNSTARMNLLPTDGTIEKIYTPRKYVVRMASAYYRDNWTFSGIALPTDLINRGMAEADPKAKFGVKLVIEDYPYAADGLELWTAMKEWHKEYIDIFYKDDSAVQADPELNNWWTELRNVGHEDLKNAPGWPDLDSKESLAEILTTIVWICTAMHAPINFGQFDYAGWMPQHPSITRKLIPEEGSKEMKEFEADPDKYWLSMISNTICTVTAMAVYEVVAAHAPDEQYIGQRTEGWTANEQVKSALQRYVKKLEEIDDHIVKRNEDKNLKNRRGGANFPFELLRPFSTPGVTSKGVPNSITV
jgi:lipoxygenase